MEKDKENKMKNIDIPVHSIILMVGPTNCGKSHFCQEHLIPSLEKNVRPDRATNIQYVSSDQIRRSIAQLHEEDFSKYDPEMIYSSKQAFDILLNRIKNATSYPVNSEYVIVDTKGISESFRQQICQIAQENNYNIGCFIFDFKDRNDYYKYVPTVEEIGQERQSFIKREVSRDISNLKKEVMGSVKTRDYNFIHKLRDQDFDQLQIVSSNFEEFKSRILNPNKEFVVIGDVHGCFEELKELIEKNDFQIARNGLIKEQKDRSIVLVGDIIDKGDAEGIKKCIKFVYHNCKNKRMYMVIGNHENFVVKYLRGQIKKSDLSQQFIDDHFKTINIIENDEKTKNMLFELFDNSKEFYIHRDFVVTHAPCKEKYLTKLDGKSLRNQRMITYPKESDYESDIEYVKAIEDHFSFLEEEGARNLPKHLFGHIQCKSMRVKSKFNLDTGCVSGGKLSSIIVNPGGKDFFQSVPSHKEGDKKLYTFFGRKTLLEKDVDLNDLEQKEQTRIKYFCKEKVPFVSGTVCPSDKKEENNDIESIENAIQYYRNCGVKKMILQPKYMGSRCNVMLHQDVGKCFAITRRGYRINFIDGMEKIYQKLQKQFDYKFKKQNVEYLLLDCELMPWKALGKGLVENEFEAVQKGVESEIEFLKENGFEEEYNKIYEEYKNSSFDQDSKNLSKKDLSDKYGQAKYRTLKHIQQYHSEFNGLDERKELSDIYKKQLEIYGQESELDIKPFMILKEVYQDGSERICLSEDESNIALFDEVSEDSYAILYFDDLENFPNGRGEIVRPHKIDHITSSALECAKEFNSYLTTDLQMEGFVVKPDQVYIPYVAPFLKVRNKDYLTLIYGYDYKIPAKHQKLIKRKGVRNKLRISIEEFEIGKKILEIPFHQIDENNKEYKELLAKMIMEEKQEEELDPRL